MVSECCRVELKSSRFIDTLLVDAGRADPRPVLEDLAAGRFRSVILRENVFAAQAPRRDRETLSLPEAHRRELRSHYRLRAHVSGPYLDGVYVYEPRRE